MRSLQSLPMLIWILRSVALAQEVVSDDEKILELPTPYPLFKIPFLPPRQGINIKDMLSIRGSNIFEDTNIDLFLRDENGNVIDQPGIVRYVKPVPEVLSTALAVKQDICTVPRRSLTVLDYMLYLVISIISFVCGQLFSIKKSKPTSSINTVEEYNHYLQTILLDVERLNGLKNFDESRTLIRAAMEVAYTSKFRMSNDAGTLYHVLATTENLAGEQETALKYMSYAYEIYENSLGPCEETGYLLEDMASLLENMGRTDEAAALLEKSMQYLASSVNMDEKLAEYKNSLLRRANELVASIQDDDSEEDAELSYILGTVQGSPESVKCKATKLLSEISETKFSPANHVKAIEMYVESVRTLEESTEADLVVLSKDGTGELRDTEVIMSPEKVRASPDCITDDEIAN